MCFFRKTKFVKPNLNINSKEIVVYQEFRRNRIYFGAQIETPRNFAFVITSNGKVLDVLYDKITITLKQIPQTTQILRLYKLNKRGRGPKFFTADTYFVNQNVFENFEWTSFESELEDREFGQFKIKSFGSLCFRVSSPKKFLNFLIPQMGIVSTTQTQIVVSNFINERISRIIEKENPNARELYFKDQELLKTIFGKLANWLNEIGIELMNISFISTKFPSQIISALSKIKEKPESVKSFGSVSFEEWQNNNPANKNKENRPKFVTIIPSGKKSHFFKESMAPYFFDEDEEEIENVKDEQKEQKKKKKIWRGIDEIAKEKKDKSLVNLDSDE